MWTNLMSKTGGAANSDAPATRRRYQRRMNDICIARMSGQSFPVTDWSFGGLKLDTDGRAFEIGHSFDVTLSIKTQNRIWDINHTAQIVRASNDSVALQFEPLPGHIRTQMEAVQRQIRLSRLND